MTRDLKKEEGPIQRIRSDRLGRSFIKIPENLGYVKGDRFVFKLVGKEIVLLSKKRPITTRQIMKLNLQRWKLKNGLAVQ
jgi:hypothetical protein